MIRGQNCSNAYTLTDRYCDKCGSVEHHAFDCQKFRRWSALDCRICNLGRRHWEEDCKEMEIDAILSAADTGISVVPSINTRKNECQKKLENWPKPKIRNWTEELAVMQIQNEEVNNLDKFKDRVSGDFHDIKIAEKKVNQPNILHNVVNKLIFPQENSVMGDFLQKKHK